MSASPVNHNYPNEDPPPKPDYVLDAGGVIDTYESVSQILKDSKNWVNWKSEPKSSGTGFTKVPYVAGTNYKCKASYADPKCYRSYSQALESDPEHIGFCFQPELGLISLDLDGCRDPKTGVLTSWAQEIITLADSYCEITPSKTGVRVWFRGTMPTDAEDHFYLDVASGYGGKVEIQIFSVKGYVTVTGDVLDSVDPDPLKLSDLISREIEERDPEKIYQLILDIAKRYPRPAKQKSAAVTAAASSQREGSGIWTVKDSKLAGKNSKMETLLHGQVRSDTPFRIEDATWSVEYPSQSHADYALIGFLVNKFGDNRDAGWDAFAGSPLYRDDKYDRDGLFDHEWTKLLAAQPTTAYGVEPAKVAQTSDSVSGSPTDDEPLPDFTSMLTGSIPDYVRAVEPDFPPEFKVMSVVTRVGLALSGKVQMKGCTNLQPRFYTTLIAPAWYGKSGSIGETKAIDNTAWYDTALSIDSAPALVATFGYRAGYMNSPDSLCAPTVISPVRVLLLPDEMKDVFEKSKASKEAKGNIGTMLLRLFDSNEIGNNTKKTGKVEFTTAHFAMLGGATSEGYDAMWMNTSGALGGLQSRMTVVGTNNPQCPQKRREGNAETAEAVRIRIVEQVRAANGFIYMTPEAESLMAVWWKEVEQHESAKRLSDIVRRYLIVLAVTNDTDTIDESLVFMGIAFGNHVLAVRAKYNPADATSAVQAFENRIIKAYERVGGGLTNRDLLRRVHPERYPGGDGAFNQARRNLVESGRIVRGEPCSVSQKDRWRLDRS